MDLNNLIDRFGEYQAVKKRGAFICRFVLVGVLSISANYAGAEVYVCVDPSTGEKTFTDTACNIGDARSLVPIEETNSMSAPARGAYPATRQPQRRQDVGAYAQRLKQQAREKKIAKMKEDAMRKILNGNVRDRNAGYRALEALNGRSSSSSVSPGPNSIPAAPRPSVITNCDAAGCWDNLGNRYNKGAGATYFPSTGGSCQLIGGQMKCP